MAIARTGTSKLAAATGTTASVTRPTGAATGDLLIVVIGVETGTSITPPAGWTTLYNVQDGANARRYGIFWRFDDGSAGPYSFTYGGASVFRWWRAISYSGIDPTTPINQSSHSVNASSANMLATAITPTVTNCLMLFLGNPDGASTGMVTDPAGMTEFDPTANSVYAAEEQLVGGSGVAYGPKTGVLNAASPNAGALIAIAPVPADVTIAATVSTITTTGQTAVIDDTPLTIAATVSTITTTGQTATVDGDPPAPPQADPVFDAYPTPPPVARLRVLLGDSDVTKLTEPGLTYSNTDRGGFEVCAFSLPAGLAVKKGERIRIERGLSTEWEGRVVEIGSVSARTGRIQISGEGYGALLKEQTHQMVYIDSDLGRWGGPSRARQISLVGGGIFQPDGPTVEQDPDSGSPALRLPVGGAWVSPFIPIVEPLYDAGYGNKIAFVYYSWRNNPNSVAGLWVGTVGFSDNDLLSPSDGGSTGLVASAGPFSGYAAPATQARRYAYAQKYYNGSPAGADGADYSAWITGLTVYGDHGVPGRGTDPVGFYVIDIVRDLIARARGVRVGDLTAVSDFIVRQFTAYVPESLESLFARCASFERAAWGTWDSGTLGSFGPTFDFGPYPGEANTWTTASDLVEQDMTSRLDQMYDSAQVIYQDAALGDGVATATLDLPELRQQIPEGREVVVNMGIGTAATAAAFGAFFLAIANRNARASGAVALRGRIGAAGGSRLASGLRAGKDALRVTDLDAEIAFGRDDFQISRVEVTEGKDGPTTKVEIGGGPDLLEIFTARLEAATTLASAA